VISARHCQHSAAVWEWCAIQQDAAHGTKRHLRGAVNPHLRRLAPRPWRRAPCGPVQGSPESTGSVPATPRAPPFRRFRACVDCPACKAPLSVRSRFLLGTSLASDRAAVITVQGCAAMPRAGCLTIRMTEVLQGPVPKPKKVFCQRDGLEIIKLRRCPVRRFRGNQDACRRIGEWKHQRYALRYAGHGKHLLFGAKLQVRFQSAWISDLPRRIPRPPWTEM